MKFDRNIETRCWLRSHNFSDISEMFSLWIKEQIAEHTAAACYVNIRGAIQWIATSGKAGNWERYTKYRTIFPISLCYFNLPSGNWTSEFRFSIKQIFSYYFVGTLIRSPAKRISSVFSTFPTFLFLYFSVLISPRFVSEANVFVSFHHTQIEPHRRGER